MILGAQPEFNMRELKRSLLILEIWICFLPLSLLLLMGMIIFLPKQMILLFQGPLDWNGSFGFVVSVACGLIGLWTLYRVASALLNGKPSIEHPSRALRGVLLGALPLTIEMVSTLNDAGEYGIRWTEFVVLMCMPLFATVHLLYLARHMFIASFRDQTRG
jgi:hypothetical protein